MESDFIMSSKQQAASSKQQAASSKQQAASSKQQAASSKQQAASSKQQQQAANLRGIAICRRQRVPNRTSFIHSSSILKTS
jgi:hypothetical protein